MKTQLAAFAVALSAALLSGCGDSPPVSLFPLVSQEDIDKGREAFDAGCRICHGPLDEGNPPSFKPLAGAECIKGDAQALALVILYNQGHRKGADGPFIFEEMSDGTLALVANYIRDHAGIKDSLLRPKTFEKAREIHAAQQSGE
jgi:mono/diheme cytochrome c family protein